MKLLLTASIAVSLFALNGCASVYSTKKPVSDRGLIYYMPKQDVVITVVTTAGKLDQVTASPSTAYADRTTPYLLEYQSHPLAKNALDVQVSAAGLLTNSDSSQTGDVVTALGSLGSIGGFVRGFNFGIQSDAEKDSRPTAPAGACSVTGTHTYIIDPKKADEKVCDGQVHYTIEPWGWTRETSNGAVPTAPANPANMGEQPSDQAIAGVFYRMNLPYRVKLWMDNGFHAETIVLSPSESRDFVLPVARSFFASTDSKITLQNGAGVPSKYVQSTDGEIAALLKLPAALLAPYFAAIGQVFSGFSSNATAEVTARDNAVSAQLARLKYEACLKAIEANDTTMIGNLNCGGK